LIKNYIKAFDSAEPPRAHSWLFEQTKVRLLLGRHERELRAGQEAVEASRAEVREAVRDAAILRTKLEAIEGWRDREILVLRTAGRDAVNSLKVVCSGLNRAVVSCGTHRIGRQRFS